MNYQNPIIKDIYFDDDIDITGGDVALFESQSAHISDIVGSTLGNFRFNPLIGLTIRKYINKSIDLLSITELKSNAKQQLRNDGFTVNKIDLVLIGREYSVKVNANFNYAQ